MSIFPGVFVGHFEVLTAFQRENDTYARKSEKTPRAKRPNLSIRGEYSFAKAWRINQNKTYLEALLPFYLIVIN